MWWLYETYHNTSKLLWWNCSFLKIDSAIATFVYTCTVLSNWFNNPGHMGHDCGNESAFLDLEQLWEFHQFTFHLKKKKKRQKAVLQILKKKNKICSKIKQQISKKLCNVLDKLINGWGLCRKPYANMLTPADLWEWGRTHQPGGSKSRGTRTVWRHR